MLCSRSWWVILVPVVVIILITSIIAGALARSRRGKPAPVVSPAAYAGSTMYPIPANSNYGQYGPAYYNGYGSSGAFLVFAVAHVLHWQGTHLLGKREGHSEGALAVSKARRSAWQFGSDWAVERLRRLQRGSPAARSNAKWVCTQLQQPRGLPAGRLRAFGPTSDRPVLDQLSRQLCHKLSPAVIAQLQRQQPPRAAALHCAIWAMLRGGNTMRTVMRTIVCGLVSLSVQFGRLQTGEIPQISGRRPLPCLSMCCAFVARGLSRLDGATDAPP